MDIGKGERRFTRHHRIDEHDPAVALCGVDHRAPRSVLEQVGFGQILEAGLGKGWKTYLDLQIHAFPSQLQAERRWQTVDAPAHAIPTSPAYDALRAAGVDECGLLHLANRSVGACFVGCATAALVLSSCQPAKLTRDRSATHRDPHPREDLDDPIGAHRGCPTRHPSAAGFAVAPTLRAPEIGSVMSMFMVDIEADGPIPGDYSMVCFGAVIVRGGLDETFYGRCRPISDRWVPEALGVSGFSREETLRFEDPRETMIAFRDWIVSSTRGRPQFISDNNGFDWQFINWYLHHFLGENPFGHSSLNLGSLYKGMERTAFANFKHLRRARHTHHPVDDARGNAEALVALVRSGLVMPLD